MHHDAHAQPVRSVRPAMTAALMADSALDEAMLTKLVQRFYDKVRADPVLGRIFAVRITDRAAHLERIVEFWDQLALMTRYYHSSAVMKHEDRHADINLSFR